MRKTEWNSVPLYIKLDVLLVPIEKCYPRITFLFIIYTSTLVLFHNSTIKHDRSHSRGNNPSSARPGFWVLGTFRHL